MNVLCNADLSQAEARVVAILARDVRLQEVFNSGKDIHKMNAANIFGVDYNAVQPDQRQLAKRVVHACVPGDTEILTKTGWVEIRNFKWTKTTQILGWNQFTQVPVWEVPLKYHAYSAPNNITWITLANGQLKQVVTGNHRLLYKHNLGSPAIQTIEADQLQYILQKPRHKVWIPVYPYGLPNGMPDYVPVVAANIYKHSTISVPCYCFTMPSGMFIARQNGLVMPLANSNYDMGPMTFSRSANIPFDAAKRLLQIYHATYPGIHDWHRRVQRQLEVDRTLVNPFGRKYLFMAHWGDELFKMAYAFVPQSTVADQLNQALLRTYYEHFDHPCLKTVRLRTQVHDSLVFQVSAEDCQAACALIKTWLEWPIHFTHESGQTQELIIPSDLEIGLNWRKYDPRSPDETHDGRQMLKAKSIEDIPNVLAQLKL